MGLGTFRAKGAEVRGAVSAALSCGYRHVDTASVYKNEADISAALASLGPRVRREEVFITSKISPFEMASPQRVKEAFDAILRRLEVDAVDLALIHWPGVSKAPSESPKHAVSRRDAWAVLESELAAGRCRAIGVSNYTAGHLQELAQHARVLPAVNQFEMHPRCAQVELRETCARMGIAVVAYSPLGCGQLCDHPDVLAAAQLLRCTPAQALLAWGMRRGAAVIPKSVRRDRIEENAGCGTWAALDALNRVGDGALNGGVWEPGETTVAREAAVEALTKLDGLDDDTHYCWDPRVVR